MKHDYEKIMTEARAYIESERPFITNCSTAVRLAYPLMKDSNVEKLIMFSMNEEYRLINISLMAVGLRDRINISVPEFARTALINNARLVLLLHNHPSGYDMPSHADRTVVRYVGRTLEHFDIALVDSIIVTDFEKEKKHFFSIRTHLPELFMFDEMNHREAKKAARKEWKNMSKEQRLALMDYYKDEFRYRGYTGMIKNMHGKSLSAPYYIIRPDNFPMNYKGE